jgi:hypothetical protein
MSKALPDTIAKFEQSIVLRLILYYSALAASVVLFWRVIPAGVRTQISEAIKPIMGSTGFTPVFTTPDPTLQALAPHSVAIMAVILAVAALALSLPVSWVYMFTRQKKGYSQSVVHTLILVPIVVAMVAALVRNSVALAFSIAGIFAAVRFRTTLEDLKDAVFVFVVMAMGLACGVQLEVAAVLSVLFVTVTMVLWYTDYARTPPDLEGERAERHMQRALALANRTSQFVARLDREILDSMAPAQLDALQARLDRRRSKLETNTTNEHPEHANHEDEGPRFDGRVTITVSDPDQAQPAIEALLESRLKRWKMVRLDRSDGEAHIVYAVRPRKGSTLEEVAQLLEREGAPFVAHVEAERWA